jgi:hypothetical protein
MKGKVHRPKFKPAVIADTDRAAYSLLLTDAERAEISNREISRVVIEQMTVSLDRLGVLFDHFKIRDNNWCLLALHLALNFVPGFYPAVGTPRKPGPRRKGERFKLVLLVQSFAEANGVTINKALHALAGRQINGRLRAADSLSTDYYAARRQIEAHAQGPNLLCSVRALTTAFGWSGESDEFDPLFETAEAYCFPQD